MIDSFPRWALTALAGASLLACGGGSGDVASPPAGAAPLVAAPVMETPASVISGTIVKGPVAGATVCVHALSPGGKGRNLGCTTTDSSGAYSISLQFAGEVIVEASGGIYQDEASGVSGVTLSAPLMVAGTIGAGSQTLVATPLTALAVNKAAAGGNLSVAGFESVAADVGAAFGLPGTLKLAQSLPLISGSTNPYGDALIGVSRMLGKGATLAGVISNTDLASVKAGFTVAMQNSCGIPSGLATLASAPSATAAIDLQDDGRLREGGISFTVNQPYPAWRTLLPAAGMVMGCTLGTNTADLVILSCPGTVIDAGMTVIAEGGKEAVPASLPSSGVLVAGASVEGRGNLQLNGASLALSASSWNFGELAVKATTPSLPLPTTGSIGGAMCIAGAKLSPTGGLQTQIKKIIDYSTFNIEPGQAANFHQPSAGSIALNNGAGGVLGSLTANGQTIVLTTATAGSGSGAGTIYVATKALP